MENYQVLKTLRPGALGVNLVVEEIETETRYLIKQVECIDEHHANRALEELMPLLKLQHPNISVYHEMFIMWNDEDTEAMHLRKAIRHHPGSLKPILKNIEERQLPGAEMFGFLLPFMLHINPSDRLAIRDVIGIIFTSTSFRNFSDTRNIHRQAIPIFITDVLLEGNMANILDVMQSFSTRPEVQLRALDKLLTMPEEDLGLPWPEELVEEVISIMTQHERILDIMLSTCLLLLRILGQALAQDSETEIPRSNYIISFLVNILRNHPDSERLITMVYNLLTIISSQGLVSEELEEEGLLQLAQEHLDHFMEDRDICLAVLTLLWSLLVDVVPVNKEPLEKLSAIATWVLTTYLEDVEIAEAGSAVLWLLSLLGCIKDSQFEQVAALFLKSIQLFPTSVLLVNNVCRGLASLAKVSELAAFRVAVLEEGSSGLYLLQDIYQLYNDDPEVVENICMLLAHLASYKEILPELESAGIKDLLRVIVERFTSSLELISYADLVLQALEAAAPPSPEEELKPDEEPESSEVSPQLQEDPIFQT
ncbi:serine/threonine kinase-like domain-containing protein STKLD1 isoform X6 [Meriones unguiculatus]|uniref:serine/threonine kinase-like domain-containing protein STKLD1 isoform X6 n=1 Tax=Meriones unguiculatus TaxID=10047 RepID=UPI00293E2FA4|nr:serine/threonine kinase-like domain-containing protein STKLD1 isoform X6 [Meriones unguiculatus]